MKKFIIGLCSAVLGLVSTIPTPAAFYTQSPRTIPIYSQSFVESSIVGYIENQSYIENISENTTNGWSKIKSGNVTGWIDSRYIVKAPLGALGYTVAVVKQDQLKVTQYQNPASDLIATLSTGEAIECVKQKGLSIILAFKNGQYGFTDVNSVKIKTYCTTAKTIEESQSGKDTTIEMTVSQPFEKKQRVFNYIESAEITVTPTPAIEQEEEYTAEDIKSQDEYTTSNISNYDVYTIEEQYDQNNYIEDDYSYVEENFYDYQDNYDEYLQQDFDYNYNNNYDYYEQEEIIENYTETGINYDEQTTQQMDEISYDYDQEETYEEMTPTEETTSNSANSDIIEYGSQFVGNPYSWGGNSLTDGIDCSHFVWQVLSNTGHYDGEYAVSDGWASLGSEVGSLDDAVAGDVIVYPGHVALYDGQGGLLEARGSAYGITSGRDATYNNILAIRHFD